MYRERLTVQHLMTTTVVALKATDSIGRCREELDRAGLRDLPVVDDHHRVVGIVSYRDLSRATQKGFGLVADIMATPVRSVRPASPALEALETMIALQLGSIPVVGPDQQLLGVITEAAFLPVARQALTDDLQRAG